MLDQCSAYSISSCLTSAWCISTALKVTTKRKSIFGGIDLTGQPGGAELLVNGGVSKLYHLICEGEDVRENGTSWGFVYIKDRIMLARGTVAP